MPGEPHLRPVSEAEPHGAGGRAATRAAGPPGFRGWLTVALAVALIAALAAWAWTRAGFLERIEGLETEVQVLREALDARERTIAAQQERLDAVRTRVDDLRTLLDEPLE